MQIRLTQSRKECSGDGRHRNSQQELFLEKVQAALDQLGGTWPYPQGHGEAEFIFRQTFRDGRLNFKMLHTKCQRQLTCFKTEK